MPVPSPRNSIRIARGNFADLSANSTAFGDGEFIYAIDQDRFYSADSGVLFPVGRGVIAVESIDALDDVDTSTIAPGIGSVLKWDGTNWVPGVDENTDAVTSVNTQTGDVVLDADDISDAATTNKFATQAELDKLADIEAGAQVNTVDSVAGKTGDVTLVKADITDFSDADYATAAQGLLADTATQPGDNVSDLTNDANYINAAGAPVQSVNSQTGNVVLGASDVGLGNVDNTSDANKPVSTAQQTALDAKADLVGGVVPTSQIPSIAITEYLGAVASEVAMLALTGQEGDWCNRTDTSSTFVITGSDPSVIGSWTELSYPVDAVTSVNTQTGTVVLDTDDISEGSTNLYSQWDNATGGINYAGGNVGIGTTDPDGSLDVFDASNVDVYLGKATDSIYIKQVSTATGIQFGSNRPGGTGGNRILQFDRASGLFQFLAGSNGSESPIVTINGNGDVGIGETNPTKLLEVNGDALINDLTIGRGAGNVSSNVAVGPGVLNANTTGSANTAVGELALRDNTEGTANTAVGRQALVLNITGTNNTAVGTFALQANTEGTENTAVGGTTLLSNTTGGNNTAVGRQALRNNTEGNSNTAVGQVSLNNNITGTNNTAIGRTAGFYIEGSNNTILGAYQGTVADATLNDTVIISAGATERLRINSSGNVGIGTTDPSYALVVAKASPTYDRIAQFTSDSSISLISFGGSNGVGEFAAEVGQNSGRLVFNTQNEEQMTVDASGNVGIGTSIPSTQLEVVATSPEIKARATGNSTSKLALDNNRAAGLLGGQIFGRWNGNTVSAITFINGADGTNKDDGVIAFSTSNGNSSLVEKLRIAQNGNVGIGTTDPSSELQVSSSGNAEVSIETTGDNSGARASTLVYAFGDGNGAAIQAVRASSQTAADAFLSFRTGGSTNTSERMRMLSNGNIGIGTTNPLELLDVRGNDNPQLKISETNNGSSAGIFIENQGQRNWQIWADRDNDRLMFGENSRASTYLAIAPITGKVGIGTSSPSSNLHVKGAASGSNIRIEGNASTEYTFLQAINPSGVEAQLAANGADSARLLCASNHPLDIFTNGTRAIRIDTSQRVGIGTTSPGKLLDVNGDALINGVTVGLGAGNVSSNTAVGVSALNANTTGGNNAAIGQQALVVNTTGDSNAALGRAALFSNTEGNNNTAVGFAALRNNTTGANNTAVGQNAGYYIEGSSNTILGAYTGTTADATLNDTVIISAGATERMRIDSSGNVGIGTTNPLQILHLETDNKPAILVNNSNSSNTSSRTSRLALNVEGSFAGGMRAVVPASGTSSDASLQFGAGGDTTHSSMRIGSNGYVGIGTTLPQAKLDVNGDALINGMTVGLGAGGYASNIAFGDNTFISNTTGLFNIAIGQNSLQSNTEGGSNTGVGQGTLVNNTIGDNNVAIGQVALNANTEGSANTAVGRQALNSNITGSLNTAVGRNAGRYIEGSNNTILGAYQGTTADATLNDTVIISAGLTERMRIKSDGTVNFSNAAVYADNTAALAGGLVAGDVYRKSDGTLMITF